MIENEEEALREASWWWTSEASWLGQAFHAILVRKRTNTQGPLQAERRIQEIIDRNHKCAYLDMSMPVENAKCFITIG